MPVTFKLIQKITVGSGGAANIEFTNIPGTYDDLVLYLSLRTEGAYNANTKATELTFNSSASNRSWKRWYADAGTVGRDDGTVMLLQCIPGSTATANNFNYQEIYIPNYTASQRKILINNGFSITNTASGYQIALNSNSWNDTAAITSIKTNLYGVSDDIAEHSTAYLYGINKS